jgi:hypothetical protein
MMSFYLPKNAVWNHLYDTKLGLMHKFSESIRETEEKCSYLLPDLRQGPIIFVGSDYSGRHNLSCYESLSFLFADLSQCAYWETLRAQLRQKYLPDGRRMSYKNLNDTKRSAALYAFLNAANSIHGLLAVILINKSIKSLFKKEGYLDFGEPELKDYGHWSVEVFEKVLRIVHLVSFFLAGLSKPYQDVLWITDEDEIMPNEKRLREVVKIFGNICGHYLKHDMGHLKIGTTKSDTGKRDIEDLVSVTDLAAGALCEVLTKYRRMGIAINTELIIPPPQEITLKTQKIMNWFADKNQPLKRLVYAIEPIENSSEICLRCLCFHGLKI